MVTSSIHIAYFSATYTTRKVVRLIAGQISEEVTEHDITLSEPETDILMEDNTLFLVGVPVYAGRVPAKALLGLHKFKGNQTPAIIVCVYGNRDYDDALLELKDTVKENGFKVISAAAFIARHSIFPAVAADRPDAEDTTMIKSFAEKSAECLKSITDISSIADIQVKGNKPYKIPGKIPLHPKGRRRCDGCGTCVRTCPVQAIPKEAPRKTDAAKCISCGRCIIVCPKKARHFGGLLYMLAGRKFVKTNSARKEPEMTFVQI